MKAAYGGDLVDSFVGVRIPGEASTLAGFRAWAQSDDFPERGVVSFLNGSIVIDMSPDEVETHNKVHGAISTAISTLADEADLGEYFWDGVLLTNTRAQLSTVSDGTFVKWATWESGRVRLIARKRRPGQYIELRGTPDWVLEVVSARSVQKDTVELPVLYHHARIPEFWLVDARGEEIDFRIHVRQPRIYQASVVHDGWAFSPVFERWFRLVRRRNRAGRWNYRLEVKDK
jgi:Uma2 family endonuclease